MMNLKQKKHRHGPRLDRRNAAKNIDYDAGDTSPSSSSFSSDDRSVYKTRSLDLALLSDRTTSFRIEGIEGEVDEMLRSLGLVPEDLSIPVAVWEARKSSSPSSKFRNEESGDWGDLCEAGVRVGVSDVNLGELSGNDVESELTSKPELAARPVVAAPLVGDSGEAGGNGVRVKVYDGEIKDRSELNCDTGEVMVSGGGGWGIRGSRPPKLAPPPVMLRSIVDETSSTWDILKAFCPEDDKGLGSPRNVISDCIDEVEGNEELVRRDEDGREEPSEIVVEKERRVDLESCSDSSNDENDGHGSVSRIKENDYTVSPNGSFRCNTMSWQKGDFLGSGSFGTVYEGFTDDGFFFAVKEVSLLDQCSQGQQSIYQLEQEISLLSQFQHENIVRYLGTDKDDTKLYIFLELVTKGSLAKLYQKYELRDSQVSAYTRQILSGLNYLHCRGVVHRDIKCANILVDVSGSVKLADFGLAKATKLNDIKSCKGTPFWMAPEVVNQRNHGYGRAADIWSLGCTVLEMLTRQIPYSQLEGMQALFRIGRGVLPPIPNALSTDAKDFILNCLQVNPDDRPTAAELLEHPFVKKPPLSFHSPASPHYARRL